jgi:polysaccharide deacetylase family protein (PEP-CTERM system associated)
VEPLLARQTKVSLTFIFSSELGQTAPKKATNMPNDSVRHHFTVDVEEYFHPTALERWIPMDSWSGFPRRAAAVIERLLELLAERGSRGTFFILGWLGELEPQMVRNIASAGHEIASHSWDHRLVSRQHPTQFRESVRRSKHVLESIAGVEVIGFRAPSWSIVPGVEWALDILLEEGYGYDSSLFPVAYHPTYGYPGTLRDPHWLDRAGGSIAEIPPATLRRLGSNVPAAGGAYLRFLPFGLLRAAFRDAQRRGQAATFYVHPWELDDFVPDLPMTAWARTRTFGGTHRVWPRISRLLDEFRFRRIDEALRDVSPHHVLLDQPRRS